MPKMHETHLLSLFPAEMICPCCGIRPSKWNYLFGEGLYEKMLCAECRKEKGNGQTGIHRLFHH